MRHTLALEMEPSRLDAYLDALAQFPDTLPVDQTGKPDASLLPTEAIRVRRWGELRAKPSKMDMGQVRSMHRALPRFIRVAYEIEDPWRAYTAESTAYLDHGGLRKLSAFMEVVWQGDERRHAAVFKAAYLRITGEQDLTPNPHRVAPVVHTPWSLERHLMMRLGAELGAAAGYTVYAAHAKDDLAAGILNVAGDEFRHLAVFWAALKWRFGDGAAWRLSKLTRELLAMGMDHRSDRTELQSVGPQDAILVTQIGLTMAQVVVRLLAWDRSLTPSRLHGVFGPLPDARLLQQ